MKPDKQLPQVLLTLLHSSLFKVVQFGEAVQFTVFNMSLNVAITCFVVSIEDNELEAAGEINTASNRFCNEVASGVEEASPPLPGVTVTTDSFCVKEFKES